MLGQGLNPESYQYHQLAIGMISDASGQYVHGQITPLKTATIYPIIQNLPLGLRSAARVFSDLRAGLGVVNLNFCDRRRKENYVSLGETSSSRLREEWPELVISYHPPQEEESEIKNALTKTRKFFSDLGAPIIPGMTRMRMATIRSISRISPWASSGFGTSVSGERPNRGGDRIGVGEVEFLEHVRKRRVGVGIGHTHHRRVEVSEALLHDHG